MVLPSDGNSASSISNMQLDGNAGPPPAQIQLGLHSALPYNAPVGDPDSRVPHEFLNTYALVNFGAVKDDFRQMFLDVLNTVKDEATKFIIPAIEEKWNDMSAEVQNELMIVAVRFCLNGPVGFAKQNWLDPENPSLTIKDRFPWITKAMFDRFCANIADLLEDRFPSLCAVSIFKKKNGNLWPFKN
eukprot:GHVS01016518.1.p1 GENE.GHVS01016518.1~~GHVS01016518.1.p1  ORF type:complete len:187 (+),score=6.30 GHVS01016518.1:70-630(+)